MKQWKTGWAFAVGAMLAGCGGGDDTNHGGTPGANVPLNVTVVGEGHVVSVAAGVDCGPQAQCSASILAGTAIELTATPSAKHVLSAWSGACSGTAPTCRLTMSAARDVTVTFVPAGPVGGWGSEMPLSAAGASDPKVAIDAAGRALVVWTQLDSATSATTSLWGAHYVPGNGWSAPQVLESNPGSVSAIDLGMDRNSGRAVVAWRQLGSSFDEWAKPFDPSTGWGATTALESASGAVDTSSVAVDGAGNATVVWSQIGPSVRFSIYASRYRFGGSWSSPVLIETGEVSGTQDGLPKVAALPSGGAVAVWKRSTGSAASLWTNLYNGSSWGTAAEVVADAGATQHIGGHALRTDAAGNATLVWGQLDGSDNALWYKRLGAGAWQGTATRVAAPTASVNQVSNPALAVNASGTAVTAWGIQDGTLYASLAAPGAGFGTRAGLRGASASLPTEVPGMGIDDQANAMAVWAESNGNMYLATRSGGNWGAPMLHESQADPAAQPTLDMNETGNAVLAWRQYVSGAGTKIYVRLYGSGR